MFGRGAKDQNVTEHKHKSCVKGVSNAFSLSMLCMSWRVLTRITWPFYPTEKERFLHSKYYHPLEEDVYSLLVLFGDAPRMRHIRVLSPLAKQQLWRVRSCLSPVLFGDTSRCRAGALTTLIMKHCLDQTKLV